MTDQHPAVPRVHAPAEQPIDLVSRVGRIITPAEIRRTGETIAMMQDPAGWIPWAVGYHLDAWNHVEAAIGLALSGFVGEAERAYEWLASTQRADGSWATKYYQGEVFDEMTDANQTAYVAVGVLHHFLHTDDRGFLEAMWPVVERAINCVWQMQKPGGEVAWGRNPDGTLKDKGLITGNASVFQSLRCAVTIAEALGLERPEWELAAGHLAWAIRNRPHAFLDKSRWSMDWYYPVLTGVLRGEQAAQRIDAGWDTFVIQGLGCKCVSDHPWVTAAETCELIMSLDAIGQTEKALELFEDIQFLRDEEGAYFEGIVVPEWVHWPGRQPAWTGAAVILAADVLSHQSLTSGLFRGEGLPGLDSGDFDPDGSKRVRP